MIKLTPDLTWKTKDGRDVKVMEMTDQHLVNTIAFLKRNIERYRDNEAAAYGGMSGGDMSSYYAEGEADCASDKIMVAQEWLAVMKQEIVRRSQ
jgi:hypothetical protein